MAMPTGHPSFESLADAADRVEVPKGFRVEIIEGNIVVTPTPQGYHAIATSMLREGLGPLLPDGTLAVEMVTLQHPGTGQRYIPDLVVMERAALETPEWLFPTREALLVAEVTSPDNADNDRVKKLRGYASGQVPTYVLVDRQDSSVTVFTDPVDRVYRQHTRVPYGTPVQLPPPFGGELNTVGLV